ncbi:hypothetical protein EBQ26_06230 [Allofranklinella schreckenbergeri]|uniref:Uncharacterized protein n=1 Tax=Allofranklinella schreckenbergeri TaxID=1076744 RepID=A0A3M6Q6V1_9BURK|nr:hypothetical protein [Allofranklinella schreckenbergeri]RMW98897.1 hypothetical protein EBQ26_06230 [Allofranklinella schreckenbergeri]
MAVSVHMEPLLEKELELAAQRKGITKSQFIIDAVERALGRKNPYQLLLKIEAESAQDPQMQRIAQAFSAASAVDAGAPTSDADRLRALLQARHDAAQHDWEAFQQARREGKPWQADGQEQAAP